MTTYSIKSFFFVLLLLASSLILQGQETFMGYWEPEIGISYKVAPLYSHKFSIEKRTLWFEDKTVFDVEQIDVSHFSNYKLLDNQSIALGLMYRFESLFSDERDEFRLTEQYNLTTTHINYRLGHRIRAEQQFSGTPINHRFRYRLTIDFPLQGTRLDVGEMFFISSIENLLTVAKTQKPEYDQRYSISLGLLLNKKLTLTNGLEYRLENYSNQAAHSLFLLSSLNIDL
ncbi:DUF2490 domain-containing protein [Zobellia amurskyensis]|uniref:DUF2490 domain-containing protein n=2 Tax=Zobellia amurskyensis TaxID=248905 RepID=A0A7X2ZQL5_9FLAO|nr:DUF2490 domain-containing protein [Zobellia amurskyensis]